MARTALDDYIRKAGMDSDGPRLDRRENARNDRRRRASVVAGKGRVSEYVFASFSDQSGERPRNESSFSKGQDR
jgi:hypothetical protein